MMHWILVMVSLLATACQSIDKDKGSRAPGISRAAGIKESCEVRAAECPPGNTPMVCTADRYDGHLMPDWHLFIGWGNSVCEAKSQLRTNVCSAELDVEKVGGISCAPDPSEGECASLSNTCEQSKEPVYCFASTYDDTKLASEQTIAGRGAGECMARFDLKVQACHANLQPSLLDDIACFAAVAAQDCPVAPRACSGDYFPFICEGKLQGGILREPYNAQIFAENSCLAEQKLKQIACNLNISPDKIVDSRCYANR